MTNNGYKEEVNSSNIQKKKQPNSPFNDFSIVKKKARLILAFLICMLTTNDIYKLIY
ncbi:MAG: hypothetical protein J6Q13_00055 [Clostridia bacterium]|nr:hypothetical protein [Clostridia bacterium]